MVILLILFILAYIAFTVYAFYDMLANGSLGLFVFSLISYIVFWYILDKNTRTDKQKVWEKDNFEVTHEESSIYEDPSYTDDSLYKEECLMDESIDFDVYLDKDIAKQTEWQNAFFGNYDKRKR